MGAVAGLSQESSPAADEPTAAGCERLAAEYDWSESEFGPHEQWDPAVEEVVRTLLEAPTPMAYCHGASYAIVYNDRFADLLGARHPRAFGQPAALVMPEIWSRPGYGEAIDKVTAGGPAFHDDGTMLDLKGQEPSQPTWTYVARSYSAVRGSDGSVLGILIVVLEIAPVLVLVGDGAHDDPGPAQWQGIELWDETAARQPLIWSGFRAGARPPAEAVSESDQRFVAEDAGERTLPINGPDIAGSLEVRRHLPDVQMVTPATRGHNDTGHSTPSGGDFYDVFALPDGRIALTIGHVTGAGTAATAAIAQVNVGLRGAALTSSDPSVILTALNDVVNHLDRSWPAPPGHDQGPRQSEHAGFGGELLVTTLLGVFDPVTGDLQLASAGHHPPAVVRRQGDTDLRAGSGPFADYVQVKPGPPLGFTGTRPVAQIVLNETDALVAHTGGLLQRHSQSLAQGRSRLLATLNTMSATAARSISQHVVDTMVADKGLEHECAILVVVRDSRAHKVISVLVPPHTIAVRGARQWTRWQLESWGVNKEAISTAVMCVSELVTNVVQHAGTPARLTMELADRLLVTVEDTGTWSAPRAGSQDRSAAQGRGLALVAAVADAMGYARGFEGSTVWFELNQHCDGR